jgi:zinc protease
MHARGLQTAARLPASLPRVLLALLGAFCAAAVPTALAGVPADPSADGPMGVAQRFDGADGTILARLDNGLTVAIRPVSTAPVVCVRAYVHTGGLYEGPWLGCGISHLTEHLVAKGAVHDMGPGQTAESATQSSDRVAEIGGQSNAYTTLDHTCYYISAASGKAAECIDVVADWMARCEIPEADFLREHAVVQRELELGRDDPGRQMWYAHAANVFGSHPAAVPVIGFAAPLAALTHEDVLAYHRRMYVPQNMVFVVAGDVDAEWALRRVREAMAGFSAARVPERVLPEVANFSGVRRRTVENAQLTDVRQEMSFQTVELLDADLYALDVLSYVLGRGPSSRLVRALQRERQLVTSISTSSWTPPWGRGVFTVRFACERGNAAEAEQAVIEQLRSLIADGLGEDELRRAQRQKIADFVYGQQTVESISASLGTDLLSTGDADFSRRYARKIQAVTAEQVRAAAERYFDFDAVVITRMVPAGSAARAPDAGDAAAPAARTPERLFTLDNGLRVVLHPTDAVGLVAFTLVGRGGVLVEDEATNGLGTAMTGLSTRGAGGRTAEQIAALFDEAGGAIAGACGNNTFYWKASCLDDRWALAAEVLGDVVVRPSLSAEELEILRPQLLQAVRDRGQGLLSDAFVRAREAFFRDSPYRLHPAGSLEVLEGVTAAQIRRWHARHVRAGSSVLAVFGNFPPERMREVIERAFADMPAGSVDVPEVPARRVDPEGERRVIESDKDSAAVVLSLPGMRIDNLEDRFAMDVLDAILSGYRLPSGWLHTRLRGEGLVYVVHAYNWPGLAPGAFLAYAACQPQTAPRVAAIIREAFRRARDYEPTAEEIDRAVNTILTAELLDSQSMSDLSMQAALDTLYGLGSDFRRRLESYYRGVTPADVRRVGRKYFVEAPLVVVTTPEPRAFAEAGAEDPPNDTAPAAAPPADRQD